MTKANRKQTADMEAHAEAVDAARAEHGAGFRVRMAAVGGSKDHSVNVDILTRAISSMWIASGGSPPDRAALDRLGKVTESSMLAFGPRDAVEGMIVAQAVALHSGTMEALIRATGRDRSDGDVTRLWAEAANLSRAMVQVIDTLGRWREKGAKGAERDGKAVG